MSQWTSLRLSWPRIEDDQYEVKDCRLDIKGTASYDGYEFHCSWEHEIKGCILVDVAEPTHWRRKANV